MYWVMFAVVVLYEMLPRMFRVMLHMMMFGVMLAWMVMLCMMLGEMMQLDLMGFAM